MKEEIKNANIALPFSSSIKSPVQPAINPTVVLTKIVIRKAVFLFIFMGSNLSR